MSGHPRIPASEFIELFKKHGATGLSEIIGVNLNHIHSRRRRIERRLGVELKNPVLGGNNWDQLKNYQKPQALRCDIDNGVVLVGSDSHYWPGIVSTAHRAFVKFCKELKPKVVIKNGDELDGSGISRHAPIGWEDRPSLVAEVDAVKDRLSEIVDASGNAKRYWPLGNHDARFETRLATVAPEYARIHGVHLQDHFPWWEPCWSVWLGEDTVIKHRFKGGIHATHNNTLNSGKTIVTGHLHSLKVTPFTDYGGTRWGVDCGTLADPYGPQFNDYLEDNPRNWRSGFVVLTFHKGRLLWPEVVHVIGKGQVEFRGQVFEV